MAMRLEFLFVLAIGVVVVSNVNAEVIINGVNMGTYYLSAPNIEISNGVIRCGAVTCPPNSYQCEVVQQSYENNSDVEMTNTCTDSNGNVLYTGSTYHTNLYPGYPVRTYSQANLNGNTLNCDSCLTAAEAQAKVDATVKYAMARAGRVYKNAMANADAALANANNIVQQTQGLGQRIQNNVANALRRAGI